MRLARYRHEGYAILRSSRVLERDCDLKKRMSFYSAPSGPARNLTQPSRTELEARGALPSVSLLRSLLLFNRFLDLPNAQRCTYTDGNLLCRLIQTED